MFFKAEVWTVSLSPVPQGRVLALNSTYTHLYTHTYTCAVILPPHAQNGVQQKTTNSPQNKPLISTYFLLSMLIVIAGTFP